MERYEYLWNKYEEIMDAILVEAQRLRDYNKIRKEIEDNIMRLQL